MQTHLKHLGLENFRVFKDRTDFHFAPITVLTGPNSSGKSSLISAIRLMKDNYTNLQVKTTDGRQGFRVLDIKPLFDAKFNAKQLIKNYGPIAYFPHWSKPEHFSLFTKCTFAHLSYTVEYAYEIEKEDRKKANLVKIKAIQDNEKKVVLEIAASTNLNPMIEKLKQLAAKHPEREFVHKQTPESLLKAFDIYLNHSLLLPAYPNIIQSQLDFENQIVSNNKVIGEVEQLLTIEQTLFNWDALDKVVSNSKYGTRIKARMDDAQFHVYLDELVFKFLAAVNWRDPINERGEYQSSDDKNRQLDGHFHMGSSGIFSLNFFMYKYLQNCYDTIIYSYNPETGQQSPSEIFQSDTDTYQYILNYLNERHARDLEADERKDLSALLSSLINNTNELQYQYFLNTESELDGNKNPVFSRYYDAFFGSVIGEFITVVFQSSIITFKDDLLYVGSNRSSEPRLKSTLEDDELSKIVVEFFELTTIEKEKVLAFVNKYLQVFGIAEEMIIEPDEDLVYYKLFLNKNDGTGNKRKVHINDYGQGVAKVLPFLLRLFQSEKWKSIEMENAGFEGWLPKPRVLLIEEPESNLHPALQSKLADMFVDAARTFNTQFIIETHSEYLIRKLQYLTARGEIKPEDTAIYYFYPPDNVPPGEKQVKRIDIQEDGSLSNDFGRGFFDEADNLAIDLYTLVTQNRKN